MTIISIRLTLSSNPDIIRRGTTAALVARIEHAARFDQQQLHFAFGIRFVFDAFRDDEHFACRYADRAIAKVDPQDAVEHDEGLVGILVIVPDEVALQDVLSLQGATAPLRRSLVVFSAK